MKKISIFVSMMLSVAFMTSCLQDKMDGDMPDDQMVEVVFNVGMEETMQTRAVIGENPAWEKTLSFGVYRNGTLLPNVAEIIQDFGTGTKATVKATLAKGLKYDLVFWAQAPGDEYYTVDLNKATVTANYDGDKANDNKRDAWYTAVKGVSLNNRPEDIMLRRPLAQINVGTTERDYADAKDAGAAVDRTSVKLAKVPNVLDLLTGTTSGEAEVNFGAEDMPSQTLTVRKGEDDEMEYKYLSMNYVLVGDGTAVGNKVTLDSYSVSFYEGSKIINTVLVSNVPARRNWRTNIISNNMLTGDATFNVTIEPGFYGEYYGNNGNFEELEY